MHGKIKKTILCILTAMIVAGASVVAYVFAVNVAIAAEKMEAETASFFSKPIVLIYENKIFEFTTEQFGITYSNNENLLAQVISGNSGIEVGLNEEQLLKSISILGTEITPVNAYISFNEETGEVETIPSQAGQTLDEKTLIEFLENKFARLNPESIMLPLIELEAVVQAEDLEGFLDEAQMIFEQEITVYYDDNEWLFYPRDHADWFTFESKNTIGITGLNQELNLIWDDLMPEDNIIKSTFSVVIDQEKLSAYLDTEIAPAIKIEPQDVMINIDENEKISFEGTGRDGLDVNKSVFEEMLTLALENSISEFKIPISTKKAGVQAPQELQDLGIQELIATGYSSFSGSPYYRNLNIGVGLSKFDGLLVAPGETFSFLDNLGVVDASTGYYKELVIKENETIPEYGGGLCQVSSTLFRAILYGGLPIITRTEHSYAVSYYAYPSGYGLDATIYQPWPDLQFLNDTDSYILIQAYSEGTEAYFKFYGTSDDRKVLMDGPYYSNYVSAPEDIIEYTTELEPGVTEKKDSAHTGFDALWYRTVIYEDGTETTEPIESHYQAWPAKYQVGVETLEEMSEETIDN